MLISYYQMSEPINHTEDEARKQISYYPVNLHGYAGYDYSIYKNGKNPEDNAV